MRFVIAVYVENKYGVLARVAGLFMRRGFNIDSLTVGETEDPDFSRITITMNGDEYSRDQLINQVSKLHNVKRVKEMEAEVTIERELLLLKVRNTSESRASIFGSIGRCNARIIDLSEEAVCIEATGEPPQISEFIENMRPLGILEMCRTGVVALERGGRSISDGYSPII